MPSTVLPLDPSRQAAPQVFEQLRAAIISLELAPGALLSRQALAERFGVSQTPVRDALIRLGEESLVEVRAQHATLVSRISIGSARKAHFLRRSVGLEVVEVVARTAQAAAVGSLRGLVEDERRILATGDLVGFAAAESNFHRRLHEAAGVESLWALVCRASGHLDRLQRLGPSTPESTRAVADDHAAIVDAVAAADATAARQVLHRLSAAALGDAEQATRRFRAYLAD